MSKLVYMISILLFIFLAGCPDSGSKVQIEKSAVRYEKPAASTKVIRGRHVEFELWYDEGLWKIYESVNPAAKTAERASKKSNILMSNVTNDVYVSIQESYELMPYGESYKHLAKWIRVNKGQVLAKEIRNVNGTDILFVKSRVEADSKLMISINYVLKNKSGGVSVTAAVPEVSFERHKTAISELMNGLVNPMGQPA